MGKKRGAGVLAVVGLLVAGDADEAIAENMQTANNAIDAMLSAMDNPHSVDAMTDVHLSMIDVANQYNIPEVGGVQLAEAVTGALEQTIRENEE